MPGDYELTRVERYTYPSRSVANRSNHTSRDESTRQNGGSVTTSVTVPGVSTQRAHFGMQVSFKLRFVAGDSVALPGEPQPPPLVP